MNIVIFDDEKSTLDYLSAIITDRYKGRHNIYTFSENKDLQTFKENADLLLADIKLRESNGIEQAILFLQSHPNTKVIFITGYPSEYYEDIFCGIRPYAFLGKPLHEERLFAHLDKLEQAGRYMESLRYTQKGRSFSIPLSDIIFIESLGRQKTIHTDKQTYILNMPFEDLQKSLSDDFVRCHSAYIINLHKIVTQSTADILMQGGHLIAVGRKFRQDFLTKYAMFKMEDNL